MRKVAGCLPPLGECYAVRRDRSDADAAVYEQLAFALADEKVDVLLAETLTHSSEAANVILGVKMASLKRGYRLPLWVVFTLADDATGRLRGGERAAIAIQRALDAADGAGVLLSGVGVNCCAPGAVDAALADVVEVAEGREVIVYANAFESTTSEWLKKEGRPDCCGKPCRGNPREYVDGVMTPDAYARRAASWARRGATVVGGCCGTTPAHTTACRVLFDRQRRRSRFFGYLTFLAVVLAVLARALGPALALALALAVLAQRHLASVSGALAQRRTLESATMNSRRIFAPAPSSPSSSLSAFSVRADTVKALAAFFIENVPPRPLDLFIRNQRCVHLRRRRSWRSGWRCADRPELEYASFCDGGAAAAAAAAVPPRHDDEAVVRVQDLRGRPNLETRRRRVHERRRRFRCPRDPRRDAVAARAASGN